MNILNILGMDNDEESNSFDLSETKTCKACKKNLPISDFYVSACKKRLKKEVKTYYLNSSNCKLCLSKYNNSPEVKDKLFKRKYNITYNKYQEMNKNQNYSCWICGCDASDSRNKVKTSYQENANLYFSIDHNHKTKKVRGLLCSNCNTGLGQFEDNQEWLQKAIEYLKVDAEDYLSIHPPTPLEDGKIEFIGDVGEKKYAELEELAKIENKNVDDFFWEILLQSKDIEK